MSGINSPGGARWLPMGPNGSEIVFAYYPAMGEIDVVELPEFEADFDYKIELVCVTSTGQNVGAHFLPVTPYADHDRVNPSGARWAGGWMVSECFINGARDAGGLGRFEIINPRKPRKYMRVTIDRTQQTGPSGIANISKLQWSASIERPAYFHEVYSLSGVNSGPTPGMDAVKQMRFICTGTGAFSQNIQPENATDRATVRMWRRRTIEPMGGEL